MIKVVPLMEIQKGPFPTNIGKINLFIVSKVVAKNILRICTFDLLVKDLIRLFGVRIAVPVNDFDALEESPSGNAPDLFSVLHHGVDVVNHELAGRTRVLTQLLLHQHIK